MSHKDLTDLLAMGAALGRLAFGIALLIRSFKASGNFFLLYAGVGLLLLWTVAK